MATSIIKSINSYTTGDVSAVHSDITLNGFWTKCGQVVVVRLDTFIVSSDISSSGTLTYLFSGLPRPALRNGVSAQGFSVGDGGRCNISVDGNVYVWWATIKAGNYNGLAFMYIAES